MQDLSGGRMVMGIGRGDSSRRVVGLKPVRVAEFERRLRMMKDLMNGRTVEWNEKELTLEWAKGRPEIPMHVAGYGPKALAVAGRVGDGVIIQLADPQIIQWIMSIVRPCQARSSTCCWLGCGPPNSASFRTSRIWPASASRSEVSAAMRSEIAL